MCGEPKLHAGEMVPLYVLPPCLAATSTLILWPSLSSVALFSSAYKPHGGDPALCYYCLPPWQLAADRSGLVTDQRTSLSSVFMLSVCLLGPANWN